MKKKLVRLSGILALAVAGLATVLALPIALASDAVTAAAPQAKAMADWMIASTMAQTMTLSEVTTETGSMVANYVPSLAVFIAAGVVFSLGAFFVARLLRAGRSG